MLSVYIVCFGVGLLLTIATALFGDLLGADGHSSGSSGSGHGHGHTGGPSPFSLTTIMAFLTGFGGIGWLLSATSSLTGTVVIALLAGVGGLLLAALLFFFLAKLLMKEDHSMRESDFALTGVLATVSLPIPEQGTGEIKFVLQGTTRSMGAREQNGKALARGVKVAVIGTERGMAIVAPLDEDPLA